MLAGVCKLFGAEAAFAAPNEALGLHLQSYLPPSD